MKRISRHVGVYGLATVDGKLLVIRKELGPYRNRWDLPGGSIEHGEPVVEALEREFIEETGFRIAIVRNLGLHDFLVRYEHSGYDAVQHLAAVYAVDLGDRSGAITHLDSFMERNDSGGIHFLAMDEIGEGSCSPLVLKAKRLLVAGVESDCQDRYPHWVVRDSW